jgi:hypothetical protein
MADFSRQIVANYGNFVEIFGIGLAPLFKVAEKGGES